MDLEEKQVHRRRGLVDVLRHWNDKEWWYTGVYQPSTGVYLSWHVIRVNFSDQLVVTLFDPKRGQPHGFSRLVKTEAAIPPGELSLRWQGHDAAFAYTGRAEDGWQVRFSAPGRQIELAIRPTTPPFTKFDNPFVERYALLCFTHARATGAVDFDGRAYAFEDALVYQDHCFGKVPSRTAWHWLAVQNEDASVISLVNYGPYAQCYSQCWMTPNVTGCPRPDTWVRLEQSVSFESRDDGFDAPWRVTSSDLDLVVTPLLHEDTRTRIPPGWPFLVDLRHVESHVRAEGRVRVDGHWLDPGPLHGVMELHGGRW